MEIPTIKTKRGRAGMNWYEISLSVSAKTDETPDEEVVMTIFMA